jgi:hypothetical protein
MSATKLYVNLHIPETRKLIDKHSGDESISNIMDILRSVQGTLEEQMLHDRMTLQEITEIRTDNIDAGVIYLLSCFILFQLIFLYMIYLTLIILFIGCFFTPKVAIDELQPNSIWWYMACNKCNKMCSKQDDKYYCGNCS